MSTSPEQPFSFVAAEHAVLDFWQQHQVFKLSLQQSRAKPAYNFYDGPPFATGLPHHGHLLASTLKDIVPRYMTMQGRYVQRRFGWDCHGLPIEYEIDQQFGKPAAEVVAEQGIKAYNQACRSIVQRYAAQWQTTITRLGRWIDFENDYKTMDTNFMESVWWVFKQLWDKDMLYLGTKVVPFSTALGTGLSNFEAGSNYQQAQDPAITVLIPLADEDASLAIWTTTPWTLPSNLGVCVNANEKYVKVKRTDNQAEQTALDTFYIAKERLDAFEKKHKVTKISEHNGCELVGKSYTPLFNYFEKLKSEGAFLVQADDYVTTTDGTGLVHLAPAFGEDDARVMQQAGITSLVCPLDSHGHFTAEVSDFAGQYVKDADKGIIQWLKQRGHILEQATIDHSYPFCPRSDTPLIYRAVPSWYVRVESIKQRLLDSNAQTHWVPEHIKNGRFGKWLEGARDWAISRNRVWGTPLPIWHNATNNKYICIGSIDELEKYSGVRVTDLHRDIVDDLHFSLPNEEGQYQRISPVLDCWFESGAMPYAQAHYPFENQQRFEDAFPAEFIAEGLDQTRGWFYTLTVLATALFDKPAFKNVIVNGIVMAEDGKKMSKRLRNYTPPDELMEKYGADALRLYLINSGLVRAEEQRFSDAGVKDMVRSTLLPWYNAFKFLKTYAEIDAWKSCADQQKSDQSQHILDTWIQSRLQSLKSLIKQHMQVYHLYQIVPQLLLFIEDLTNTYIRLNRARFWGEDMSADKQQAYQTLYNVLLEFCQCMAPFTPFLAETIYRQLRDFNQDPQSLPISVHLCQYPQPHADAICPELEQAVARLQQILIMGRNCRNQAKIKVKTPLKQLTVIHDSAEMLEQIQRLAPIIKKELNIKHIDYNQRENEFIELYAKPNSPLLGKRLQKRFAEFRAAIEALDSQQIRQLEAAGKIEIRGEVFNSEEILVFRKAKAGSEVITNRFISILVDTSLDEAQIREGQAREVVNRIQNTRKQSGLQVADRINLLIQCDDELARTIAQHKAYIQQETLCLQLEVQPFTEQAAIDAAEQIDGHPLVLECTKHTG